MKLGMAPSQDASDQQDYEPCLGSGIPINLYFTGKGPHPRRKFETNAFDRRSSFLHGLHIGKNSRMVVKSKGIPDFFFEKSGIGDL